MALGYNCSSMNVNNHSSLNQNYRGYIVLKMKYGERLSIAREHAKFTQTALADKINNVCTQENISKLERGEATGSEYTVQFSLACGVSPLWLAEEKGDMVGGLYILDPKIRHAVQLLEPLPEYAVDHVIQEITETTELIARAQTPAAAIKNA